MADHLMRTDVLGRTVLDVGSRNVNGTYRPMVCELGGVYTGLDIVEGPNVDVVSPDEHRYPLPDAGFDIVISGSTAEHVRRPWWWIQELARLVVPGGLVVVVTHWKWPEHDYPRDYWRFMPAGLRELFALTGQLQDYCIETDPDGTIAGSAFRTEVVS